MEEAKTNHDDGPIRRVAARILPYIMAGDTVGTYGTSTSKSMSQRYVSNRFLANQPRADRPDYESVL